MAKRIPLSERPALIRDPADWAKDCGWVSRRRAVNLAVKIENVAVAIDNALGDDEGSLVWQRELRRIAKSLAPATTPREEKIAATQEP